MGVWSTQDIRPGDSALIDQIVTTVNANPLPQAIACQDENGTVYVGYDRQSMVTRAESGDHFVAFFEDGELKAVVSFNQEGVFGFFWHTYGRGQLDPNQPNPPGQAFMQYVTAQVRARCNGRVSTGDKNPNAAPFHQKYGIGSR